MTEEKMLGLSRVFECENSHPRGDIVFVHGLAGHPWGTWHPQGKKNNQNLDFWPFWLGQDLQKDEIAVNVWTFGYDAPRFGYVGEGMPRFDLASNLWEYLDVNDIGDRPLIFITHSMGGLVVKDLIRTAQNFDDKKAIIQQTQGIVFLSTPHQGSHLANLIDNFNVEELRAHTPQLRDLNQWYRQNIEKLNIKTYVFYETKPMAGVLVVDEDSANPGIKDVQPIAISADHNSIAKPGRNDLVYLSVVKFCQQIFASKKSTQGKKIEKDSTGYNMAGIPPELYQQLRQFLLECEQFESDRTLRSVVSTYQPLRPWRFLPEANSISSWVNAVISYLYDKYRTDTKENALVLLLRLLKDLMEEEDQRHQQLVNLILELENAFADS